MDPWKSIVVWALQERMVVRFHVGEASSLQNMLGRGIFSAEPSGSSEQALLVAVRENQNIFFNF